MKKTIVSTKRLFFALMMMLTATVSANAMSYEQARNEALFLTDKMAYELNLTDEQYEAAYEINLDYLMGVTSRYDVYGTYWERRNLDLSYILLDWQWNAFIAASYFYRPLYWDAGYWHFGIYARYPHRDYFYFGRPHFYHSYHGAHAWHRVGGHGYYHGHREHFHAPHREHIGMHDRWNHGDFRSNRHSSTRVTAGDRGRIGRGTIERNPGRDRGNGSVGSNRGMERRGPSRSIEGRSSQTPQRSIDRGSRSSSTYSSPSRSGISSHRSSTYSGSSRGSGSFSGGSRSGSYSGGSRSGSFSGGSRSGSFSGGSRSGSFSGGSHSGSYSGGSRSGSFSGGSHSGGFSGGGSRGGGSFSGGSHGGGSHGGGHSGGGGGRMGGHR